MSVNSAVELLHGAREGQDGLGLALSGLQTALLDHPKTKVLIANGRWDLVTPYFASRWLIDQLAIPSSVRDAIHVEVYDGGHMMYLRSQSRQALARRRGEALCGRRVKLAPGGRRLRAGRRAVSIMRSSAAVSASAA